MDNGGRNIRSRAFWHPGLAIVLIALLEIASPVHISLAILYSIPVGLGTWAKTRQTGLLLSLVTLVLAFGLLISEGTRFGFIWNDPARISQVVIDFTAVLGVVFVVDHLKKINKERLDAQVELGHLRGLLPVCAWCHRIHDGAGNWSNVESYVEDRSDVKFTHTLCPECLQKELEQTITREK